jgi:DNA-binding HxlR family transcriptional regulator
MAADPHRLAMTDARAGTPRGATPPTPDQTRAAPSPARAGHGSNPVDSALFDLIRRPYLAEILAALDQQPHTLASLRRATGASRRQAVAALRALAGHRGITRRPTTGSWDVAGDRHVQYRLTAAGHDLIGRLFDPQLWAALYQDHQSTAPIQQPD